MNDVLASDALAVAAFGDASVPGPQAARLARLLHGRAGLGGPLTETWRRLSLRHAPDTLEPWAAAMLRLMEVNCGPGCLLAFLRASGEAGADLPGLCVAGARAAEICRHAGGKAAAASIEAFVHVRRRLDGAGQLDVWWNAMVRLAQAAPESVEPACTRIETMLTGDAADFAAFVAAGLRIGGREPARRLAFFSLEDPTARRLLVGRGAGPGFSEMEAELKAFLTALWGTPPQLRALPDGPPGAARRASIAGPVLRLPESYRGVSGDAARRLFHAASAHAGAHLALGAGRFTVGTLKPLQIVLTGLIEDARIEALAMRRYPGLRRLWAPYHVAVPGGVPTAASLLARLSRALFDAGYKDGDEIVAKARNLFDAASGRLDDPAISREIGSRLGNDFGQRRIQFNARGHVVEPLYRDDGLGLWDFSSQDAPPTEAIEMAVEAARAERREATDGAVSPEAEARQETGRARPVAADGAGRIVATYPEWDALEGIERPDWVSVREMPAAAGDARALLADIERGGAMRARVAALVRSARLGRAQRLRRQAEGHDLDLDAAIDADISRRIGEMPDPRVFRSTALRQRDLAVLVLIDTSESTRARLADGASILDVERLAVAVLAEAMERLGDSFALLAFAANGRGEVRITPVKGFDQSYDRAALARLSGLRSGLSTRLGAALRHAGAQIAPVRSFRKLVMVLTDGEPSDIDVPDDYLAADARRAVLGLRARGIDTFGVTLDPAGVGAPAAMFGRANTMAVRRIEELPARLAELYFRLARR